MKLVFFDIECASVHKNCAKICAFGYVVCDENFRILEKEDILINPKGRFELTDRKGEKGIVLPYEYAEFKKYPVFPQIYPRIKSLLEDKESVVFGHSVLNDVKYLNLETRRFKLPSFEFRFSDSQLIYMTLINDFSHQLGLEHIAKELGVDFVPHRAADDAYATMRVLEAMCASEKCGYSELLSSLCMSEGKIENYNISCPQSRGFRKYGAERLALKAARAKARTDFYNNLSRKRFTKGGKLKGAVFQFSRPIEDRVDISISLVNGIYELGGKYSNETTECDYYVCDEGDETVRTKRAKSSSKTEIINVPRLREILNG